MKNNLVSSEERFLNAFFEILQQYYENETGNGMEDNNEESNVFGNSLGTENIDNLVDVIAFSFEDYYRNEQLRGIPLDVNSDEE